MRWEMVHPRVELLADDEDAPGRPHSAGLFADRRAQPVADAADRGRASSNRTPRWSTKSFPTTSSTPTASGRSARPCRRFIAPTDAASLEQARRRFIYQELLVLQLALAIRKWRLQHQRHAPPLPASAKIDARIRGCFRSS